MDPILKSTFYRVGLLKSRFTIILVKFISVHLTLILNSLYIAGIKSFLRISCELKR